jgi:Zn-finger nucleic acid-binding protein
MTCPKCSGEMVELERSGVRIDACRNCRGVFLDRGELDKVIEKERRLIEHDDGDDFMAEITGRGHGDEHRREKPDSKYGFDGKTAERLLNDYRGHKTQHKKKKRSFLEELLD